MQHVTGSRQELILSWIELASTKVRFALLDLFRVHDTETPESTLDFVRALQGCNIPTVTAKTKGKYVECCHYVNDSSVELAIGYDNETANLTVRGPQSEYVEQVVRMFSRTDSRPSVDRNAVITMLVGIVGASRRALIDATNGVDTRALAHWTHLHSAPQHEQIARKLAPFLMQPVPAEAPTPVAEVPAPSLEQVSKEIREVTAELQTMRAEVKADVSGEAWAAAKISDLILTWDAAERVKFGVILVTDVLAKDTQMNDFARIGAEAAVWKRLAVEPPFSYAAAGIEEPRNNRPAQRRRRR